MAMTPRIYPQAQEHSADDGQESGELRETKSHSTLRDAIKLSTMSKDPMNDSGYASISATPDRNSTASDVSSNNTSNRVPCSDPIPRRLKELDSLLRFRRDINIETENRYKDIEKVLVQPLYDFLLKKERKYSHQPILIRPMILGKTDADAKPYIIVSCSRKYSERVKKFFKKDWVKTLCEPGDEDVPRFQVYVVPRPTTLAATLVNALYQGTSGAAKTNCGTLVEFNNDWGKSRATLGGLIKVTQPNGEYTLYGLTSGHSLVEDCEDIFSADDESDGRSLDNFEFSESPNLADQWNKIDTKNGAPTLDLELANVDNKDAVTTLPDEQIGVAFIKMAVGYDERPCNYDWAIIQALSPSRYLPNLLCPPDGEQSPSALREGDLKLRNKPFQTNESVIVIAGASGCLRGNLSPVAASLLLAPSTTAVRAYAVRFPDGSSLREGDSGSWVVSESTREVIGPLSVLDAFGDAIVIPLADILDDVRQELGAASVELPTTIDIFSKRTQASTSPHDPKKRSISDRGRVFSNVHEPRIPQQPANADSGYASAEHSLQTSPGICHSL